jgi:hypothetical protein
MSFCCQQPVSHQKGITLPTNHFTKPTYVPKTLLPNTRPLKYMNHIPNGK